jgi:hypothetical protein
MICGNLHHWAERLGQAEIYRLNTFAHSGFFFQTTNTSDHFNASFTLT